LVDWPFPVRAGAPAFVQRCPAGFSSEAEPGSPRLRVLCSVAVHAKHQSRKPSHVTRPPKRPSTPNFGDKLFTAESDTLLVETPCASDAEFVKKLRYLLAHEARIVDGPPNGHQEFGSILVAVDRYMEVESINRFIVGRLEKTA
jgi:hypothetical protein